MQQTIAKHTKAKAHHHPVKLMGCGFVLTAIHSDPQIAWDAIRASESEIVRIERLISSWDNLSETSQINRNAGIKPVVVSKELFNLIERSLKISRLTAGAFDISGTLSRYYWSFDKKENPMLAAEKIEELRDLINYKNIVLNQETNSVFLVKMGMKIGFGGIGKGYAAMRAKEVMLSHGIENGLINASGDLMCWGSPPNKENWEIKIPDPNNRSQSIMEYQIPYGSVVSSGNYENYTIVEGKKLSHIIDPRTGMPVENIQHVSVVSTDAEFADAMATAISVMGISLGLYVVNRINGIECCIIDNSGNKYFSEQFNQKILCKN